MERLSVTTPFGRRPMTLALARQQTTVFDIPSGKSVDKWRVHRDACDARGRLGLQDRSLAVLNALLSFYPKAILEEGEDLVVFPSNNQLSSRANGIAGSTLRRSLLALIEAGLIARRDSPNGKRYARRDAKGEIETAYGFDLSPLLVRSDELATLAEEVAADRRRFRIAKERVSLCRRDTRKLIAAAVIEALPGDWERLDAELSGIIARIPRAPTTDELLSLAHELTVLHETVVKQLQMQQKTESLTSNGSQTDQHIQDQNTQSIIEFEQAVESAGEQKSVPDTAETIQSKIFPLTMVLRACPQASALGRGGRITSWSEMLSAATTISSMLEISPSAFRAAEAAMGQQTAAAVIACIYERSDQINSAGGYLRDLTAKAAGGKFSAGPMVMALLRAVNSPGRAAA